MTVLKKGFLNTLESDNKLLMKPFDYHLINCKKNKECKLCGAIECAKKLEC